MSDRDPCRGCDGDDSRCVRDACAVCCFCGRALVVAPPSRVLIVDLPSPGIRAARFVHESDFVSLLLADDPELRAWVHEQQAPPRPVPTASDLRILPVGPPMNRHEKRRNAREKRRSRAR